MAWAAAAASMFGDLAGSFFGASSADKANKTNIKLARENREWSERMSNTAIQRKVADLTRAGGNPALAFTEGQSASTPSVSSATVDPTFRPEWMKGSAGTAAMLALQTENLRAQTFKTMQEGRVNKVEADIRENLQHGEQDFRANRFVESHEWDDLKTKIMRNTESSTASQAKYDKDTLDDFIAIVKQQREMGRLDLPEARNQAGMQETMFGRVLPYIEEFLGISGEAIKQRRGLRNDTPWRKRR